MEEKDLLSLYKNIVESFRLEVNGENYIYSKPTEIGGKKHMVSYTMKPVVLPSKDHISNIYAENDDGEFDVIKVLYNPLHESAIKGNGNSLNITKNWAERITAHAIAGLGEMLLMLTRNPKLQTKTPLEINKFLGRIQEANNQGVKDIVDEETIKKWCNLYTQSLTPNGQPFVTYFLNKLGRLDDGVKYNRSTTLYSKVYDDLLETTKDKPLYGIKLRNKDITLFKILFEYIIPDIKEKGKMEIGSNDSYCPAFISIMTIYHRIISRINEIATAIKDVSEDAFDTTYTELYYEEDDLLTLGEYRSAVNGIPDDIDLNRNANQMNNNNIATMDGNLMSKNVSKPDIPVMSDTPSVIERPQPMNQTPPPMQPIPQQQVQAPVMAPAPYPVQAPVTQQMTVPYNQPLPISAANSSSSANEALSRMLDQERYMVSPGGYTYNNTPRLMGAGSPSFNPPPQMNYGQPVTMPPYNGPMMGGYNPPLQGAPTNTMYGYQNPTAPVLNSGYRY